MKVLFNATTLRRGGAIQVAAEFCHQLVSDKSNKFDWILAVSRTVDDALKDRDISPRFPIEVFGNSPASSLNARRALRTVELNHRPDCVFTLFGPAYVSFRAPHLCGVGDGWITHAGISAYRSIRNPLRWITRFGSATYKGIWLRAADAWVVEAECAREGLARRFGIPRKQISVVENTCASHYRNAAAPAAVAENCAARILVFCCAYPHKNVDFVPVVARAIKLHRPQLDFEFILTLEPDAPLTRRVTALAARLGVQSHIRNIGPVALSDGPDLYRQAAVCFLPTLLETFSATYPEAMAMKVPMVTSDLDFARNICGESALYFRPGDASSAARHIISLLEDAKLRSDLVDAGTHRLERFPTSQEKYACYLGLLAELCDSRVHECASAVSGCRRLTSERAAGL